MKYVTAFILFLLASCRDRVDGSYSLGNNIYISGGGSCERFIMFCGASNWMEGCSTIGNPLIPLYDSGYNEENIKSANADKNWIIAKSAFCRSKKEGRYWIMSKDFDAETLSKLPKVRDSILRKYVIGPLTLDEFKEEAYRLNIKISLEE